MWRLQVRGLWSAVGDDKFERVRIWLRLRVASAMCWSGMGLLGPTNFPFESFVFDTFEQLAGVPPSPIVFCLFFSSLV